MSDRYRMRDKALAALETIVPHDVMVRNRAMAGVLTNNGDIRREAVAGVLPRYRLDWDIAGTPTVGSVVGHRRIPEGGRIQFIEAIARVAPTSAPFTAQLTVNGTGQDFVSITAGAAESGREADAPDIVVPPGGIVRLVVTSAGGVDITVTAYYIAGEGS